MFLPTGLREEVSYDSGGTLMWSEREIKKLTALGDAVDVACRTYRIPQHHVRTVEDAMAIIGVYRRFVEKIGSHALSGARHATTSTPSACCCSFQGFCG